MSHLVLYLFGLPRVKLNEEEVHVRRRKAMALLAYLAMAKRTHSREELATFLWPEYEQSQALAYLRRVLSDLNKSLCNTGLIIDRATARLDLASIWVDVDDFHQHVTTCKMHNHPVTVACEECVPHLEHAVNLYQGDFLEGFSLRDSSAFDEWQLFHTEELRRELAFALERLAHWYHNQLAYQDALAYAQRWLAMNPLHEPAHRSLMLLYREMGQRSGALQQYQLCTQTLREELDIIPSEETTALYEDIRTSAEGKLHQQITPARNIPSVSSAHTPLHNLPAQLTSFIGREQEIREIQDILLRPDVRLLTLTGTGGTGKTRLSLAIAERVLSEYPDGVFFISLASLRDPALVLDAIAQTLGLRNAGDMSLSEIIERYLMGKEILLVLDNFEHVVQAAPEVSALLTTLPQLKVLVTSRSLLRVIGEHIYSVLPLDLPDSKTSLNLQHTAQNEAVQLFTDRAAAVKPGFTLTDENAYIVAKICTHLDGLPLAIELAAARVRLLAPLGLLSQLENRLSFLTGGAKNLPRRQRTLRSTIEWSTTLLGAEEQILFRRLAVFTGGCTLQAAESICNTSKDAVLHPGLCLDVLNCLERLVDQSLVQQSEVEGVERFTMLETVREFALEQLIVSDEAECLQEAHAQFYLALVEEAEPQFDGPEPAPWLKRLDCELDNLRAAVKWALEHDVAVSFRLATALAPFWRLQARITEGRDWLTQVLAQTREGEFTFRTLRARALQAACDLAWFQGDSLKGVSLGEQSVAIYRTLGDRRGLANALRVLGQATLSFPDSIKTLPVLEESIALYRDLNDRLGLTKALHLYGWKLNNLNDTIRARTIVDECHQLAEEIDALDCLAKAKGQLGRVYAAQGDLTSAISLYKIAFRLFQQVGNKSYIPNGIFNLAYCLFMQGHYDSAEIYFQKCLTMWMEMGNTPNAALATEYLGRIAWHNGNLLASKRYFMESLEMYRGVERRGWKVAWCLLGLAQITDVEKQPERVNTLIGATETLRSKNLNLPNLRGEIDRIKNLVRTYLDAASFDAAYARGLAMTKEQAIDFALSEQDLK